MPNKRSGRVWNRRRTEKQRRLAEANMRRGIIPDWTSWSAY